MHTLTKIFKSLSDETRLYMLGLLIEEPKLCACDLTEILGISQTKASRHLRQLENVGLLDERRERTRVYYHIADDPQCAQKELLEALPRLLPPRVQAELSDRLQAWHKHKKYKNNIAIDS